MRGRARGRVADAVVSKLQTEDQRRWHSCLRKQGFKSTADAHTAGRHQGMKRGAFTAYQCLYCGLWHITKKKPPEGWPWCNAGCQLSPRPCRVPCSMIGEIDRLALLAYHRERIVWVLRRKTSEIAGSPQSALIHR